MSIRERARSAAATLPPSPGSASRINPDSASGTARARNSRAAALWRWIKAPRGLWTVPDAAEGSGPPHRRTREIVAALHARRGVAGPSEARAYGHCGRLLCPVCFYCYGILCAAAKDPMCQERTHAPQQKKRSLFDHLVGDGL
jgi:hypothetical protein